MYADKKKSQKVYVESKCVSRDDCCWDETPDTLEVVTVNSTPVIETISETVQQAS